MLSKAVKSSTAVDDNRPHDSHAPSNTITTTTDTSTTTPASRSMGYKGKALRSWAQLPADLIRLVATCYLKLVSDTGTLPISWTSPYTVTTRQPGYNERQVYLVARDFRVLKSSCGCVPNGV
ncbi:hypothetical protein C8F01DRAFT_1111842 [Mycena amicta]|nr:hypothetical protein C8F01DRAFT_1168197 [Mycena amicta]KAJ7054808.1 hypothetical protein C8F01DRAFT_1161443 [Mycena amicta]KAJ7069196.1 hypothetical protein C8F01DRAFT_1111842 [Mycena amicta]